MEPLDRGNFLHGRVWRPDRRRRRDETQGRSQSRSGHIRNSNADHERMHLYRQRSASPFVTQKHLYRRPRSPRSRSRSDRDHDQQRTHYKCRNDRKSRRVDRHRQRRSSSSAKSSVVVHRSGCTAGVVSLDHDEQHLKTGTTRKKKSRSFSQDDTIGHFQGRPGGIIADRYEIRGDVGIGTFGRVRCMHLKDNATA
jgi:hypothetical protein